MGHQIEHQILSENCQLTQCSCGRGSLRIKSKVILLSSSDIAEISKLFGLLEKKERPEKSPLIDRLNGLTEGKGWAGFSLSE
jgi:hypothetical protein